MPFWNKKKKTEEEVKKDEVIKTEEIPVPTTLEILEKEKARILKEIGELKSDSETYVKDYSERMALLKSVQDSIIKEKISEGTDIENSNKAEETVIKKKEINAKVAQTGITAGGAVLGCAMVPFVEQKVGPAMSKIASQASQALFKKS